MSDYHGYLTNMGYLIKKDRLSAEELAKIRKELTFRPIVYQALRTISKPNSFLTYKESPNYLYVPKYYGWEKLGPPVKNLISRGGDMAEECRISQEYFIREHQKAAYEKTLEQITDRGGGILSVFCGWGKTFMAIFVAVKLRGRTLVLVHKEDLFDQWKSEIQVFTNGKASIGSIQQDKIDVENRDFVLAMLPSLAKRTYDAEIFRQFRLLIVDECHHIGSEVFSRALDKTVFRHTLGLSATPNRKDGLTTVFTNYLGPIFHVEKRSNRRDTLVIRIPLHSNSCFYADQFFSNGTKNTAKMVLQLAEFPERNDFIIEVLRRLYSNETTPAPRKTLVLSKSRKHLMMLHDCFKRLSLKRGSDLPITCGFYWGMGRQSNLDQCPMPIPLIQKRNGTLAFDRRDRQNCIFPREGGSEFCIFHQYCTKYDYGASGTLGVEFDPDDMRLCGREKCYYYFLDQGTDQSMCDVCRGEWESVENVDLSEALNKKGRAKSKTETGMTKVSGKARHKMMLEETKGCHVIFGTNDIASEALNIPGLNTLIQATPQQQVEQTVGRILRKQTVDRTNNPLIIDLIDNAGNFVNHSRVRTKTYRSEGFKTVNLSKLDLDGKWKEEFPWDQFDEYVKQSSFGLEPNDGDDDNDVTDGENDAAGSPPKCLL